MHSRAQGVARCSSRRERSGKRRYVLDERAHGWGHHRGFPASCAHGRASPPRLDFPEPFGKLRCLEFTDPDAAVGLVGNLGARFPVRNYAYTLERWAREPVMALNALGVISKLPLSLFTLNAERQAGSTVAKPQCHICGVARDGRRLAASTVTGKGNFAMTAAAIATCAKTLLDRKDQGEVPSGVLGVDDVFDLAEVRAGFEAQGIRIATLS